MRNLSLFMVFLLLLSCGSDRTQKQQPAEEPVKTESPANTVDELPAMEDPKVNPEDAQRTEWQNPDLVLERLGDLSNKVVADLGAGAGYFSFKLAQRARKVIALDIDPRALEYIKGQKEIVGEWSNNIETRLTPADVPNLLENEVDVVLIVNTYSFIPDKEDYLPRVFKGMREGGKLAIVDFKTGSIPVGPSDDLKTKPREVIAQLRKAGFKRLQKDENSLQFQYIILAEK